MTQDYAYNFENFPMPPNSDSDISINNELSNGDNKIIIKNSIISQFENFTFDNSNLNDIFKLTIYLCNTDNPSTIIKICFEKACNNVFDYELVCRIYNYINYIKISNKTITHQISVFGEIYDILTHLIIKCLEYLCPKGSKYSIKLNISKNINPNSINYPIYDNSIVFEYISPITNNTFIECPICYNEYSEGSKVLLNCDHCLCKECFYNMIKSIDNIDTRCPVCRQIIDFNI